MKKAEQYFVNVKAKSHLDRATEEMQTWQRYCGRLRSCNADVFETASYYVLRSYSTVVAVIHKPTDILCDVLRMVYGYTSTSAQHIAKFSHDYGFGKYGCETRYTWRDI